MNITKQHKKDKCPKCGSIEIVTMGLDQMCCDCDWDNSLLLVQLGQLDNPFQAVRQQFDGQVTFESLTQKQNNDQENADQEFFSESASMIA